MAVFLRLQCVTQSLERVFNAMVIQIVLLNRHLNVHQILAWLAQQILIAIIFLQNNCVVMYQEEHVSNVYMTQTARPLDYRIVHPTLVLLVQETDNVLVFLPHQYAATLLQEGRVFNVLITQTVLLLQQRSAHRTLALHAQILVTAHI